MCEYAEAQVPLRERRKRELRALLPGEQEPWAPGPSPGATGSPVAQCAVSRPLTPTAFDPFCSLPVKMDSRMQELIHHC